MLIKNLHQRQIFILILAFFIISICVWNIKQRTIWPVPSDWKMKQVWNDVQIKEYNLPKLELPLQEKVFAQTDLAAEAYIEEDSFAPGKNENVYPSFGISRWSIIEKEQPCTYTEITRYVKQNDSIEELHSNCKNRTVFKAIINGNEFYVEPLNEDYATGDKKNLLLTILLNGEIKQ